MCILEHRNERQRRLWVQSRDTERWRRKGINEDMKGGTGGKKESQVELIKTKISGAGSLLIKARRKYVPFQARREGN